MRICLRQIGQAILFLMISPTLASSLSWAFSFPTAPASPSRVRGVTENLFKTYYGEIQKLERDVRTEANSNSKRERISAKIRLRNQSTYERMLKEPPGSSITREQATEMISFVREHSIAGEKPFQKYDPDREVGFCFGRATLIHLELLRRGVPPISIGKIFAIGKLRHATAKRWDFHVVTVVRGPGQEWLVIDELEKRILKVDEWMRETEKMDFNPRSPWIRYYFTDAVKFQPHTGGYGQDNLYLPYFRGYFVDLANWFDRNSF